MPRNQCEPLVSRLRDRFLAGVTAIVLIVGSMAQEAAAVPVETINITNFVLDASQIAPPSEVPYLSQWRTPVSLTTSALTSGQTIEVSITFAPQQRLRVANGDDLIGVIPGLAIFPTESFVVGTNVYDLLITFTDVDGDLSQNNLHVDVKTVGGGGLSFEIFDLTNSFFTFGDIHFTLTAEENFTFGSGDRFVFVRADDVSISVPEPATLALFGFGLAGLGAVRRKKLAA